MPKLILNKGYGVQFEGDYHKNGHPKNLSKVSFRPDAIGCDTGFATRVHVTCQMIELWNARSSLLTVVRKLDLGAAMSPEEFNAAFDDLRAAFAPEEIASGHLSN
ncbi:hypothetical protein [Phaeobacter inhibens]|uniref:hypothetical protein n=1 Tax=Phaeobacter inhibens TaxID=221822 RepID=UPI00076BB9F3|nr:hypothetical protein [Phaeobacter inhibens]KXF89770.1 hypothetical protein AT574_14270 [Phaeobacter inhibens]WHP69289.1 hypothetical protein QMZ01_03625 [Phaeobacter inhibens]